MRQWIKNWSTRIMFAAVVIPINDGSNWQVLSFSKIPQNKVEFKADGMSIDVKSSAGPIVYPLKSAVMVNEVELELEVDGKIKLDPKKVQGEKGFDDYLFRVGLVLEGKAPTQLDAATSGRGLGVKTI